MRHLTCIAVLLVVALVGCGEDGSGDGQRDTTSAADTTAIPDQPPERLSLLAAKRAVEQYYRAIDNQNFSTAWSALAKAPRVEFEGFSAWKAGHEATVASDLRTANASRLGPRSASVRVSLDTIDLDDCGIEVPQSFTGTWVVESVGGIATLTEPDIEKVAGEDPASSCVPSTPSPQPAATPPSSDCHPSYEGACLDPASSDYDCASGDGDGPDYVDGPVYVVGDDEYGLDGYNNNGVGCE